MSDILTMGLMLEDVACSACVLIAIRYGQGRYYVTCQEQGGRPRRCVLCKPLCEKKVGYLSKESINHTIKQFYSHGVLFSICTEYLYK